MNLLENYIKEVYDIKTVDMEGGWSFVLVDMMVDCYGCQRRTQTSFADMEEWEIAKKQGYYMA